MRCSVSSRDGFISGYFFRYFLLFLLVFGQIVLTCHEWSEAMNNMKIHNRYVRQEAIVLAYIKCRLKQNDLKEGTYEAANITFSLQGEKPLRVIVVSPYSQYLEVEIVGQEIASYQAVYPDENQDTTDGD